MLDIRLIFHIPTYIWRCILIIYSRLFFYRESPLVILRAVFARFFPEFLTQMIWTTEKYTVNVKQIRSTSELWLHFSLCCTEHTKFHGTECTRSRRSRSRREQEEEEEEEEMVCHATCKDLTVSVVGWHFRWLCDLWNKRNVNWHVFISYSYCIHH